MEAVVDMLGSERFLSALVVGWLLTPIGFILVGVIGESRVVPLWRRQSRAFMPGDVCLGVVLAVGWYLYPQVSADSWWTSLQFGGLVLATGVGVCYVMRTKLDAPYYPFRARNSPTKRYHDYLLYIGYLTVLVYVCVPSILTATTWNKGGDFGPRLMGLVAFLVWFGGLVHDAKNEDMPFPEMHITDWLPIWRTWRIYRQGRR